VLRDRRVVIVWDNFEVARGIEGTSVSANLTDDDRAVLLDFLQRLRGGQSKVLITSRSREEWLGHENCFALPVGGFDDEERWEYCAVVLRDLGLNPDRDDPAMTELMDALGGHPLAMRAILPQLKSHTAKSLADALRTNADALDLPESDVSRKLAATLRFVQDALPAEQRPLLVPLSMHENFVDLDLLEQMAKRVEKGLDRPVIDRFAASLGAAGLLRDRGQAIHELHPALTGYLRATLARQKEQDEVRDAWARAFVDVMGSLADALAPRELHEQRVPFHVHGANFHHALSEADRLGLSTEQGALLQSLAAFAQNTRDFAAAERLFTRLAELHRVTGDFAGQAPAFHHLGMIAQEQRDFAAAEQWYRKSLAIKEKQGNEHHAAITYHQLGIIAGEQRDFAAAEQWYRKSLAIKEKQGNEHGAARTYGQLGILAGLQERYEESGQWLIRSIVTFARCNDAHGAKRNASNFMVSYRKAPADTQAKLAGMWHDAGLGDLPSAPEA
jgi:tetratricopeptide (TPR) repeat protein